MRTIFFGTPEIAVPALRALAKSTTVVGVVCQPDRPAGRGLQISEPAVKRAAVELELEVHQPVKVKTGNLDEWIRKRSADVAVVLAYGRILPASVLAAPRRGCMNLHASILPKYRGAAPIQWAIMRGETETGVSLMQMDEGLDSGPVYSIRRTPIAATDDAGTLTARLAQLCTEVVREDLGAAVEGRVLPVPQDEGLVTLAPPITRDHGKLDWNRAAVELDRQIRGLSPRPSAFTTLRGKALKVLAARAMNDRGSSSDETPGTIVKADKGGVFVACAQGTLEIVLGQLEGRKATTGADLVNGRALRLGDSLGT